MRAAHHPSNTGDFRISKFDESWKPPQMQCARPGAGKQVDISEIVTPPDEPEEMIETEEEADAEPFDFAHWRDGSLTVWGAQQNEDGSITLLPDQVREIKRQIAWSAP